MGTGGDGMEKTHIVLWIVYSGDADVAAVRNNDTTTSTNAALPRKKTMRWAGGTSSRGGSWASSPPSDPRAGRAVQVGQCSAASGPELNF